MGSDSLDDAAVRQFIDQYRDRCLWFLQPAYYPTTSDGWHRVLDSIERHGDRDAFVRVAQIRTWLSRHSSAASVDS